MKAERARLAAAARRMGPGTARSERALRSLGSAGFGPEERSFEDWAVLLARWAEHLRHVGPDDQPDGRWSALLDADEALLLARIASPWGALTPLALDDEDDAAEPAALAHEVLRIAGVIDRWQRRLARIDGPGAAALVGLIQHLVDRRLGALLRAVHAAWGSTHWRGVRLGARAEGLGPMWAAPPGGAQRPAARSLDELRRARSAFRSALERLRERAGRELAVSLHSGRHEPAAALLLAFLPLLGTLQAEVNRFGDRLVDFYVDEVLRMRTRPARPDRVHLVLQPAPLAPPTELPAGTAFLAGKDGAGRPIRFLSDSAALLDDVTVAALGTLRLERDPLMSPESELGYASRSRLQWLPVLGPGVEGPSWPIFGGSAHATAGRAQEAEFGLAIGCPELLALEGERRLSVTLRLAHQATSDARLAAQAVAHAAAPSLSGLAALFHGYLALERPEAQQGVDVPALAAAAAPRLAALAPAQRSPLQHYRLFLLERTLLAPASGFAYAAGRLFIHWLLAPVETEGHDWLDADAHTALVAAATRALGPHPRSNALDDPLALFFGAQPPQRALVFAHLFTGLFAVRYSGPEGWCEAPGAHVVRPSAPERPGGVGLQLVLSLPPDAPALVGCDPALHGAAWPAGLPVLQLRLRAYGGLYPFSMLESARLLEVAIELQVNGLRSLTLHNQIGRVDPGQVFQPFGPLPAAGAWLVVGGPELASKHLTALRLNLRWAGLPTDAAGFAAHYAGYPDAPDNRSFRAAPEVLRDGRWIPATPQSLFAAEGAVSALWPDASIRFDPAQLQQHYRPRSARGASGAAEPTGWDLSAQQGFVRLRLAEPAAAFGHALYAGLLTDAISANLRRRRRPLALPRAPYTPQLEGLSADYRCQTRIHLDAGTAESARLWHLHPAGIEPVFPARRAEPIRLLPAVPHDGQLFIGLRASRAPVRVSLLLRLRDEWAVPRRGPAPVLHWSALCGDRWQRLLPTQVVSDGTAGLLTTGIVVLDLPEGIDTTHQVMPGGLYWLALGADSGFEGFAGLQAVHAQALSATRERTGEQASSSALEPLPPGRPLVPARAVPGLDLVHRAGPAFGGRAPETRAELLVRTGERLRHRQRASQPWDVERLVLDAFPEVALAKCFSASELDGEPGRVLVAVVPGPERFDRAAGLLAPRLNASELQRIAAHLQAHGSPHARFEVRNAAYEHVQLRCALQLLPGAPAGATLQRAARAVFDHLSPWVPGSIGARFGWVLRQESLETCLRALPGVAGVAGLSMLHVVRDDIGFHTLGDTAAEPPPADDVWRVELHPALPWSIAVPMEHHELRVITAERGPAPLEAGVGDLGVGRTFIVGEAQRHG
jgi:hypothetical protein